MKLLFINRKQLLRAIHAATVALFLAAQQLAHAQTATADGSGNVTITGSGTGYVYNGTNPTLTPGGTLSITSGSTITNTDANRAVINLTESANINNAGNLTSNSSALNGYVAPIYTTGGAQATSITNTGTLSGVSVANNFHSAGIYYNDGGLLTSPVTVSNSGSVSASAGLLSSSAIYIDTGGNFAVTNSASGTLSSSNTDHAYTLSAYASGKGSVVNAGTITASQGVYAADINVGATGDLSVTNSGTLLSQATTRSSYGIEGYSTTGNVAVTNTGSITASSATTSGFALTEDIAADTPTGSITVTNSGALSAMATGGTVSGIYVRDGSGNALVTNTASIYAQGPNLAYAIGTQSGTYETGALTIHNSGPLTAVSTNGTAAGVYASTAGNISVQSSNAISATSSSGSAYGINLVDAGQSTITIANTGAILASGQTTTSGIQWQFTSAVNVANAVVTNSAALSITSGSSVYGIIGLPGLANSLVNQTVDNSGGITLDSSGTGSGSLRATGISLEQGGTQTITNSGAISITAASGGVYAEGIVAAGNVVAVNNTGAINVTGSGGAVGIFSDGLSTSVNNTASIIVTGTGSNTYASGLSFLAGNITATNSGNITATGSAGAFGIGITCYAGDVTLSNSGNLTATNTGSGAYSGSGIYVHNTNGNISVSNSGTLTAASLSPTNSGSGIYTIAAAGATSIVNNGSALGFGVDNGYGINAQSSGGAISITNNGSAEGSTAGIFANSAATVNNYGQAIGTTYSIDVATGSTVNLLNKSSVQGLIKGGSDDTSTSILNFELVVPGNFAAAKAALNTAIADYDAALAAAPKGPGNDVTSNVVDINGVDYQWQDFAGVEDNLRNYASIAGYGGIGSVIDNLNPNSPPGSGILTGLGGLSPSQLPAALEELSPRALQVLRNIAFDGADFTTANINDHLANLRDGLTGFDSSGFSVNAPGTDSMLTSVRSHLLAWNPGPVTPGLMSDSPAALFGGDAKELAPEVNTQPVDRFSSFISGSVILASLDNTFANTGDTDYTTGSVLAGADYRIGDHFTVGALFDYSHTGANGQGSRETVDSYMPGIYGSYVDGPWYANAMLAAGYNRNSESRDIDIPGIVGTNRAVADGEQGTANLTGGYEFKRGAFKFGPMATLQYVHLHVDDFNENGPTALNIGSENDDSLRTQLGVEARYSTVVATCYGPVNFTPHVQASWQHEYMDNSDGITASFNGTGAGSFVTQGNAPERDSAFFDVGLDAGVSSNITLFLDYQAQAGQDNFFAQSAQGGLRIGF